MSEYMNKPELFIEPVTRQYGNHMVMTNVHKSQKTKYVNIDTQFRDEYNYQQTANYNMTLPERITDIRTIEVTNIELPMTIYNISANLGNNSFGILNEIITIPDGNYNQTSLLTAFNLACTNSTNATTLTISFSNNITTITSTATSNTTIYFNVDDSNCGNNNTNLKSKLGWLLGFRKSSYEILLTSNIVSENMINLSGPRYLYLAIDEFNKSNKNTFISPMSSSLINKNIIARISLDMHTHPFGTILPANRSNGMLISDTRTYTGKIDLHKINVQLLNEYGNPIILNGMDFAFCLEIVNE
jgi:hypothetical protein